MKYIHEYDLNLLVIFSLLFETRSVTQTAERAGVTQSAISHALSRMRTQFGDPLFIKSSNGMVPTVKSEQLYESVQLPLKQLQVAVNPEIQFDPQKSQRTFVLAMSDYVETLLLPRLVNYLAEHSRQTTIRCTRINDFELEKTGSDVDLIIGRFEKAPENFRKKLLWREDMVTIVSKNHPRVISNRIGLQQFVNEEHVLISPKGSGVSLVDAILSEKGLKRRVKVYSHYFMSPTRIVAETELIATIPRKIAELASREVAIKCLKPPIEIPAIDVSMLWGPVVHYDPAHQWLRNLINEILNAG
ncbi:LysR family transcriptional regulator [Aliikangiella coralliicola]|uniref:LysR family transcriptional regulator n=1 Tax=Aliikangiella coralliicola TaxID=2592383 RepID=A0A545U628_9GAMM|nr:LysR family transcriptional regulator [Aliikangiella coralliicola]TQV84928.1 LysR family transcriptional regulator [Aliikangiella coralliicola]